MCIQLLLLSRKIEVCPYQEGYSATHPSSLGVGYGRQARKEPTQGTVSERREMISQDGYDSGFGLTTDVLNEPSNRLIRVMKGIDILLHFASRSSRWGVEHVQVGIP